MKNTLRLIAAGAAAGAINGLFGTGGGTVMVFALMYIFRERPLDSRELFANVCASVLPIALSSALTYSSISPPDLTYAASIGGAAVVGGIFGSLLLGKMKPRLLKIIFSGVMILSGGIMIFR